MRLLKFLWQHSRPLFVAAFGLAVAGGISGAVMLALIQRVLSQDSGATSGFLAAFIGTATMIGLARIGSQILLVHLAQEGMLRLVMRLTESMLGAPLREIERLGTSRLIAALTDDVSVVTSGLSAMPAMALSATLLVASFAYLAWMSLPAFLGVSSCLVIGILAFTLSFRKAERFLALSRAERDELFEGFRGLLHGFTELKLNRSRRDAFVHAEIRGRAATFKRHNLTATVIQASAATASLLLFYGVLGVVIFLFPWLFGLRHEVVTGYVVIVLFMIVPIDAMAGLAPALARASFYLKRLDHLEHVLEERAHERARPMGEPGREAAAPRLELVRTAYRYAAEDGEGFAIGPIDLVIEPGELIFVLGGNGSGKTTLAKMLTGLYVPDSGELRCNDRVVTDGTREQYREHFAAVFSEPHIFPAFPGIQAALVARRGPGYLEQLRLSHKVRIDRGRLSTVDLSHGQRKRLALLTALLEDRAVYVLDEWAADQDVSYKRFFYRELIPALRGRGRTVIVITHDEEYVETGSRVLRLESGRPVFHGDVVRTCEAS